MLYINYKIKNMKQNLLKQNFLLIMLMMLFSFHAQAYLKADNEKHLASLAFSEDFEGEAFPPDGWSVFNLLGDDATWAISTTINHTPGGNKSAWHDWTAGDGWLVTPALEIPAEDGYSLSFWSYNADAWAYGANKVLVSTGSGDPADGDFVEIWTAETPAESSWEETFLSLDDFAGETIYIAFLKTGEWAHVWFVDDVQVGSFEPIETFNVSFVVQDEDGLGIENAVVTLDGVANPPGVYLFENMQAGEYDYLVTAAGYLPADGSLSIDNEDVTITVTLSIIPLFTLTFVIEDDEGTPIDNATIILEDNANPVGDYVFTGLLAGVYAYTVSAEGYEIVNGSVSVTEDTTEIVTLIAEDILIISEFPFIELFGDDSETRDFWSQALVSGNALWTFGAGAGLGLPANPYIGELNARYVSVSGTNSPITKLITPVLDLTSLTNPRLTFYYAQQQTGVPWAPNQNETKVYYRTASDSEWVEIIHLTANVLDWIEVVVELPSPTETYQLAFEGINNGGRANVLDNVIVEDTPAAFDVTFVVEEADGTPITNAVISLAGQTNPAGNYLFENVEAGELHYSVTATGYAEVSGTISLVDSDLTVHIVMTLFLESIPFFEDFAGIPNGGFPDYWSRNTTNWYVTDAKLTLWDYMYEPVLRRAYTPLIDATGITEVMLSFNQFVWDFGGGYSLKVQTSLDGEIWTDQWVWDMDTEEGVPPADIEISLDGVDGHLFYIAFTLDGLSGDNDWQIDFLNVTGTEEAEGYTVNFLVQNHLGDAVEDAVITLGETTNAPGNYLFVNVEPGSYDYLVAKFCFLEAAGIINVIDGNLVVEISLDVLPGDANGDGIVNVLDVIAVANYYIDNIPEEFCFYNADINNDGTINVLDVISIINIFASGKY